MYFYEKWAINVNRLVNRLFTLNISVMTTHNACFSRPRRRRTRPTIHYYYYYTYTLIYTTLHDRYYYALYRNNNNGVHVTMIIVEIIIDNSASRAGCYIRSCVCVCLISHTGHRVEPNVKPLREWHWTSKRVIITCIELLFETRTDLAAASQLGTR
jgi:hypothetical protein